MKKRVLSLMLAAVMVLGMIPGAMATDVTEVEYTIYPLPREITYEASAVEIPTQVNVVWGEDIDSYTKQHLTDALAQLSSDVTVTESAAAQAGAFNILVGVRGDNGAADAALSGVDSTMTIQSAGQTYTEDIFTGAHAFDAYIIRVTDSGIAIVGKDTDAAYYAITTLKHIFEQMAADDTATIHRFTLRDYASVAYRGFIEGYYGIPWSHENRIALMEWGSEWKMNMYVFAPKDDLYHNTLWRQLYPEAELPKIAQLAETGLKTKNRYVYALHPFQTGPFNFDNFDRELKLITDKFDQLYGVGVRQFAILADDAGTYSGENFARLLNALNVWRRGKGDVYPLIFCPDKYNADWAHDWAGDYVKLAKLNDLADDDIAIFWTGLGVCGHATADDAKAFVDNINNATADDKTCRNPLLWLNWPVDDINMSRLILGPGSNEGGGNGYSTKVPVLARGEADYFTGIISNPMQQAQLNKIPLFAVADFAWNDDGYNGQQSWADSFQYVDPDAADALHTLAKHMSDPSPNGLDMICGESEELKDQLDAFLTAYTSGGSVAALADALIAEFETIVTACDALAAQSKNQGLLEEIDSHRRSLRDLSESAIAFIRTIVDLEEGRNADVWGHYSEGAAKQASAQTYPVPMVNGSVQMAQSGAKRIVPFVNTLADALAEPVQRVLDPDHGGEEEEEADEFYAAPEFELYGDGTLDNAVDGDIDTMAWFAFSPAAEQCFGINYAKPVTIYHFRVLSGEAGANPGNDHLYNAVLEYRLDGEETFQPVSDNANGVFSEANKTWDLSADPLVNVVEIRARMLTSQSNWLKLREFGAYDVPASNQSADTSLKYTVTAFLDPSLKGGPDTIGSMVDNSTSTFAHVYNGTYEDGKGKYDYILSGQYVGVDLGCVKPIGLITILQGQNDTNGDKMKNAVLEYSIDGTNYTVLKENINENTITFDCFDRDVSARYIRLRNTEDVPVWFAIRDFSVEQPLRVFRSGITFGDHNSDAFGPDSKIVDGNDATYAHYGDSVSGSGTAPEGAYIGLQLGRMTRLGRIRILQGRNDGDGDRFSNATLEYSSDGVNYTTILDNINQNVIDIDLSSSGIRATHVRLRNGAGCSVWLAMRTFSVQPTTASTPVDTNVNAYKNYLTITTADSAAITALPGGITLQPGEYLGIKLPRIRELNSVTVTGGVPAGLTLKAGCSELELETVDPAAVTDNSTLNARYIRLVNETQAPVTVSFSGMTVTSKEIDPMSMLSSTMGAAYSGTSTPYVSALFDGNLNTEFGWDQAQSDGGQAVLDMGQVIHINSLQFIVNDSMSDWIRHADVEGSTDPNGPWTKLVTIGAATAGATTSMTDADSGWTHTISYCYSGSKPGDASLNVDARYLRITLKQAVDYWPRIREIGINNLLVGNEYTPPYIKTANDPTFDCPNEVCGHGPQNLTDGNVNTTYIPDATSGTLIYRLSEGLEEINQISILQSPNTLSNAAVSVRAANSTQFVPVGSLAFSMNEFNLMGLVDTVAEIKIQWTGMAPELHEILTVHKEPVAPDKTALETALAAAAALEETVEYENSAVDLLAAYAAAKADAQAVKESTTVMQSGVDQAVSKLSTAIDAVKNQPFPVTGVALDKTAATLYTNPGSGEVKTVTFSATVVPPCAANKNVTWRVTPATGVVSLEGSTVTAVGRGAATVTATAAGTTVTAAAAVTVLTNLEGSVTVEVNGEDKTARPGKEVEAHLSALNLDDAGVAGVSYQWFRNESEIASATAKTYTLTNDDIDKTISVTVTATPGATYFFKGEKTGALAGTVGKNAAPAAPTLTSTPVESDSKGTITVTSPAPGETYEYKRSADTTWTDVPADGVILDLDTGSYQVRIKENDLHDPGQIATKTVTDATKTYFTAGYTVTPASAATVTLDHDSVEEGTAVSAAVTPNPGYAIKSVTVGETALTGVKGEDGAVVYTVENVAADVEFAVTLERLKVTITHNLTGGLECSKATTGQDSHTVDYGAVEVITIEAEEGCDLPDSDDIIITVTDTGAPFTAFSYSKDSGTITITGGATQSLTITAAGVPVIYHIGHHLEHLTCSLGADEAHIVGHHAALAITFTPDPGYDLPKTVTITMSEEPFTDFTYENGAITIVQGKITGDLVITAAASETTGPGPDVPVATCTVTFNSQGGSAVAAQTVTKGGKAVRPADPTRSGYTFGGWYTDAACTNVYDFDTAVTGDVTLYAKWTAASSPNNTSRPKPTTTTTTSKNEDGSTTTTVTNNRTGTVTETTEKADGTVEVKETLKDGTVTETVKNPDGSTEVVETKPDGTVTETVQNTDGSTEVVETKPDGTVTAATTDPEGGKVEKVTDPEKNVAITVTDPTGETVAEVKLPAVIPEPETKFEDVPEDHWAEKAINTVAGLGLVKGVGDDRYDMTTAMDRGSLATVLYRLSNGKSGYEAGFRDVPTGKYYTEGVAWAAKVGVVTGISADVFAPEQVITREQLAVMLARYAKLIGMDTKADAGALKSFADSSATGDWAVDGVAWCVKTGILRGKGGNVLDPTADVSRAEVAVMLERFVELMK